jgi:hypothetical protein
MSKHVFSVQIDITDRISHVINGVEFELEFEGDQELDMDPLFVEAIEKRVASHYPHIQLREDLGYSICNIRLLS